MWTLEQAQALIEYGDPGKSHVWERWDADAHKRDLKNAKVPAGGYRCMGGCGTILMGEYRHYCQECQPEDAC